MGSCPIEELGHVISYRSYAGDELVREFSLRSASSYVAKFIA